MLVRLVPSENLFFYSYREKLSVRLAPAGASILLVPTIL